TKRRKSKDDDRKRKSRKKSRESSKASSKHRSDKDDKSGKKSKNKSHDDNSRLKKKFEEISNDDYFSKNNEFSTWLKRERKLYFSDLSSDSARALFSEFVSEWNKRELDDRYYDGITTGPRSSHKWNIRQ
ncbi:hypothetical protein M569_14403, partial [Genlisea aurea]